MNLAFANTKKKLIESSAITPMYDASTELENDIYILCAEPEQKDILSILFRKCVEDHRGKRKVLIMSQSEYEDMCSTLITEVDDEEDGDLGFNPSDFFNNLGPYREDFILIYSHTLSSTQTFMNKYCAGFQNIVCCTDIQTDGKGRKSNSWVSPVGCLMFSFKSALENSSYVSLMQYLEALVMCEALKEFECVKGLDINIKWPNDVYVDKKHKICGILCQSALSGGMFDVTSGIGVNISNRKPTVCIEEKVCEVTGKKVHISRAELLGKYMRIWNRCFPRFSREGLKPYLTQYYQYWLHSNQNVNVVNESGGYTSVIIKGISENGLLRAIDAQGNLVELHSDGNTFNFLEGLISKKL